MPFLASLRDLQSLSAQQWLDRAGRTVPQALSVVLVVAIAWQLVQITWLLLERGTETQALASILPAPPTVVPRKDLDVQAIAGAHLFGVPQAETKAPEEAQPTQMNLVLSAVFATDDPVKGLAIIGESAQSAKVYAVGGSVRPDTRLHSVYVDRVILDRSGQLEALSLPKRNTGIVINRAPVATTQFSNNLQQLAQSNPGVLAEVVRPQPVFANGVQRGYRVYPGRNRQQFARLGLQPGDLVLSINGTPLDDPQRGLEVFSTLGASDRVTVTVERNGQAQDLTLNTAQITLPDGPADDRPARLGVPRQRGAAPAFTPTPTPE